jgi:hypothetical protein
MDHHHARPVENSLDSALGSCILMFSPHTRERLCLVLGNAVIAKMLGSKDAIVTVVVLRKYTRQVPDPIFEGTFA